MSRYIISTENMSSAKSVLNFVMKNYEFAEFGIVSDTLPILSSLTIMDNIALPKSYHDRISLSKLEPLVYNLMVSYGIQNVIYYHKKSLSMFDVMIVKLLRCLLMEPENILMYLPHDMIHTEDYLQFIDVIETIKKSDILIVEHSRYAKEYLGRDFKEIGFTQWQTLVTKV